MIAENEEDIQTLIKCVENLCNKWRTSVNHLKTKNVPFREVCVLITDFLFTLQNKNVHIIQKYTYLSIILEEHMDFKAGVNKLCSKGGKEMK